MQTKKTWKDNAGKIYVIVVSGLIMAGFFYIREMNREHVEFKQQLALMRVDVNENKKSRIDIEEIKESSIRSEERLKSLAISVEKVEKTVNLIFKTFLQRSNSGDIDPSKTNVLNICDFQP